MPIKSSSIDLNSECATNNTTSTTTVRNSIKKPTSKCPHVILIDKTIYEIDNFDDLINDAKCCTCGDTNNLWICLRDNCKEIYCSTKQHQTNNAMNALNLFNTHKKQHFDMKYHTLMLNVKTKLIFCDICNEEVLLNHNEPSIDDMIKYNNISNKNDINLAEFNSENGIFKCIHDNKSFYECINTNLGKYIGDLGTNNDENNVNNDDTQTNTKGLVGLRNLGNTCYLNSALQALSNCPSLTNYFLECVYYVKPEKFPRISNSYMRIIHDIWSTNELNTSLAPMEIVQSIKLVNSTFKGYLQQDSQEFLLCLLDQLHEELKRVKVIPLNNQQSSSSSNSIDYDEDELNHLLNSSSQNINNNNGNNSNNTSNDDFDSHLMSTSPTQSDTDSYETCDSTPSNEANNFLSIYETDDGPTIEFSNERRRRCHSNQFDAEKRAKNEKNFANSDSGFDSIRSSSMKENELILNPMKLSQQFNNNENHSTRIISKNNNNQVSDQDDVDVDDDEDDDGDNTIDSKTITNNNNNNNNNNNISNAKKLNKKVYTSIVSDVFDGKMIGQVQCLKCETISNTIETFQDLSLPIPNKEYLQALQNKVMNKTNESSKPYQSWRSWILGMITGSFLWGPTIKLEDCLTVYFSEADLKGDNMYNCEKCKKLSDGIKYSKILRLPEILCIHLKRFRHDYMFSTKIGTYVEFPLKGLDMSPYLHKYCKNKAYKYDLCAIICHHGGSGSGHYTCYAFNHIDSEWYEYDDQFCSRVDENTVKNAQAYVLFYKKENQNMRTIDVELTKLLSKKQVNSKPYYLSKSWINKLKYFSEPGPITNHDYLCSHGDVYPEYWHNINELVIPVSEEIYNYLNEHFSNDDISLNCNLLYPCKQCLINIEQLQQRRYKEKYEYTQLRELSSNQKDNVSSYIININWFKEWFNFVEGKSKEIPGPINNFSICTKNKNGTYDLNKNANTYEMSKECWSYLYYIYGGGPLLMRKQPKTNNMVKSQTTTTLNPINSSPSVFQKLSKSMQQITTTTIGANLSKSDSNEPITTPPSSSLSSSPSFKSLSMNYNDNYCHSQEQNLNFNQITSQNIIDPNASENLFQIKQTRL